MLYLRDVEQKQRHLEAHQREDETAQFAVLRARLEQEAAAREEAAAAAASKAAAARGESRRPGGALSRCWRRGKLHLHKAPGCFQCAKPTTA